MSTSGMTAGGLYAFHIHPNRVNQNAGDAKVT